MKPETFALLVRIARVNLPVDMLRTDDGEVVVGEDGVLTRDYLEAAVNRGEVSAWSDGTGNTVIGVAGYPIARYPDFLLPTE